MNARATPVAAWIAAHRLVVLGLVTCVLAYLASRGTQRLSPAYPGLGHEITGTFPRDGHFHGEPLADAEGVRQWGSLAGSDAHTGTLALGPFPAPARLRFGVTGHPTTKPNELALELVSTGARTAIGLPQDIGARWNIVDLDVPSTWVGQPVRLLARDATTTAPGWLGLTEPLHGGRGDGLNGFRETFAAWVINGWLLALLWFAALRLLARAAWLEPQWRPLVAAGMVAAAGYAAFWIYFASPTAGKLFSGGVLLAAFVAAVRRPEPLAHDADSARVARLAAAVGIFYLAVLHLFPTSAEFDGLAANRFRENLPGDNTLPHNLAATLCAGHSPKVPGADWQSSDRPPLQTGWLLLTWPAGEALRLNARAASGTAAVWLQLLWIPAAYGLLCSLRLPPPRAAAWTGVMALNGFFLQHTVYTWPKLSAAAFAIGAFGMWILPAARPPANRAFAAGGFLAALGWLSHGGVAFAYLALAPWLAWQAWRGAVRGYALAAGAFLLLAMPWVCYQQFYEPPANMLLKNHLAGVDAPDARGTWATIRDRYHASSWAEIVERKQANFAAQVRGSFTSLFDFSASGASGRRSDEFFHTVRALGWWLLAVPALGLASFHRGRRAPRAPDWPAHAGLLTWAGVTVVLWCLLMFHGGQAVIHQGSFTVLLTLFVLLAAWFERAGPGWLVAIALLQGTTLATTYVVSNARIHGPAVGRPLVVGAALLLAFVIARGARRPSPRHL